MELEYQVMNEKRDYKEPYEGEYYCAKGKKYVEQEAHGEANHIWFGAEQAREQNDGFDLGSEKARYCEHRLSWSEEQGRK